MNKINKFLIIIVSLTLSYQIFLVPQINAQSYTTVIGGEGLPEVEVNLDSLYNNKLNLRTNLKHAGQNNNKKVILSWPKDKEKSNRSIAGKPSNTTLRKVQIEKKLDTKALATPKRKANVGSKRNNVVKNYKKEQDFANNSKVILKKSETKISSLNKSKKDSIISKNSNKIVKAPKVKTTSLDPNKLYRMIFLPSQTKLDGKYRSLIMKIASYSNSHNSKIQIRAFASASGNRPTYARRVSLSRALAVRSELIQFGVNSSSIDVRALGESKDGNLTDRVDVVIKPQ